MRKSARHDGKININNHKNEKTMEETRTTVEMTAGQKAAFEAWQAKQEQTRRRKENREAYAQLVDEQVELAIPELVALSEEIKAVKRKVFGNFREVLAMKRDVMGLTKQTGQRSHTFTNTPGTMRLTLGSNTVDDYRDTAEDGIEMVKQYIASLGKDEETRALVDMVLRLLARDQTGRLKASRVLQLRKMAEQTGNDQFMEGVRIIEEAYQPIETKQYIRAEVKDEQGAWKAIPLSVTDN